MKDQESASIKEKVEGFIMNFVKRRDAITLGENDDIFSQGFVNSLFAMQLVLFVEKEFGIVVEDDDLEMENFRSLSAIVNLVERKTQASG